MFEIACFAEGNHRTEDFFLHDARVRSRIRNDRRSDEIAFGVISGAPSDNTPFVFANLDIAHDLVIRLSVDDGLGAETRWEPEPVTITLGGVAVPLPPGAFLQATQDGEAGLVAAVREAVGNPRTTADLFAGLGTFALALPGKVYAAEGARDAILSLKGAANAQHRPVFAEHRDLYRRPLTKAELDRFDAIVLDPPRAGARDQAEALASAAVGAVAYVSCNPSSFARDARMMVDQGWSLEWVQPVGQFRWSTHVELAACFVRQASAG